MSDSVGDQERHGRTLPARVQNAIDLGERRAERERVRQALTVSVETGEEYKLKLELRFKAFDDTFAIGIYEAIIAEARRFEGVVAISTLEGPEGFIKLDRKD